MPNKTAESVGHVALCPTYGPKSINTVVVGWAKQGVPNKPWQSNNDISSDKTMLYRRNITNGGCYFFTLVTEHRQAILTLPGNIDRLREAFRREQQSNPFTLDAIIVLPEHIHCIITLPEGDADYSGRLSRVKRYFSVGCIGVIVPVSSSRQAKRERPVWQRRFWEHLIRDDEDWRRHMDYIHYNPVKHGHVASPWDWQHSSLQKCMERGWYDRGWGEVVSGDVLELAGG